MTNYETKLKERAEELRDFMISEVLNDKSKGYETLAAYVLQKEAEAYIIGAVDSFDHLTYSDVESLRKNQLQSLGLIPPSND